MFGGRDGVASGRVHHENPTPGRRLNIDVVNARSGPAHNLQLTRCRDDFARHLRAAANNQPVVLIDDPLEIFRGQVRLDVDVEALCLQQVDTRLLDLIANKDVHNSPWKTFLRKSNARYATKTGRAVLVGSPSLDFYPHSTGVISSILSLVIVSRSLGIPKYEE